MLPADTDAHLWWTFHEFCHLRDQLALTAGPTARERCGDLLSYQPGPLLSAAAMLIIDELSFTGTLLDALRSFMDQRRPAATAEDLDLPEAALLLAGEGIRPWQTTAAVRASLKRVRANN